MVAEDQAKRMAAASPPSQVVRFDRLGQVTPIAHYQLPEYLPETPAQGNGSSLFEAAVKALVIGGLMAAGASVLGDLVNRVNSDLDKETVKSRNARRRKRGTRVA